MSRRELLDELLVERFGPRQRPAQPRRRPPVAERPFEPLTELEQAANRRRLLDALPADEHDDHDDQERRSVPPQAGAGGEVA